MMHIVPQATQLSSQIDAALQAPAGATMGSLSSVFAAASNNLCKAAADACNRVNGALNARASHSLGRWRALYAKHTLISRPPGNRSSSR